jgi:hypothetical protein
MLANESAARKGQIAEDVKRFVPGAFVGKTKAVVDRPALVEDQEVVIRHAQP